MNIGVDIDGVLTNIQDYVFEYGSKFSYKNGKNLKNLEKNKYETSEIFNWQNDEDRTFWDEIFTNYAQNERPRFFASEVLKKINEKHKIYIITARTDDNRDGIEGTEKISEITKKWLIKNDIPFDNIFFPGVDKRNTVLDNKIDIMIEDSAENIKMLEPFTKIIVFDAIYNKDVEGYARVNSWYEILYHINELEKDIK